VAEPKATETTKHTNDMKTWRRTDDAPLSCDSYVSWLTPSGPYHGTNSLDAYSTPFMIPRMSLRRALPVAILSVSLLASLRAAEEKEAPKNSMKDVLKARIAEDAKKTEAKKGASPSAPGTATTAPAATASTPTSASAQVSTPAAPAAATAPAPAKTAAQAEKEKATVLPKVEVKKGRITVLDQQLAKQEQDIARERKNLKASEVDVALNDMKVAQPLAIFGGESSQFRQRVASERVELMEAEKDILEAIARARTKEEKQELQKQLDQIRAFRRDLDKSLR
jgi:hypothetical protein